MYRTVASLQSRISSSQQAKSLSCKTAVVLRRLFSGSVDFCQPDYSQSNNGFWWHSAEGLGIDMDKSWWRCNISFADPGSLSTTFFSKLKERAQTVFTKSPGSSTVMFEISDITQPRSLISDPEQYAINLSHLRDTQVTPRSFSRHCVTYLRYVSHTQYHADLLHNLP